MHSVPQADYNVQEIMLREDQGENKYFATSIFKM